VPGKLILLIVLCAAVDARAYCVYNQLADREIVVAQETHPDPLRDDRRFRATIKPGTSQCCEFHRLDCNPGGRENSVVNLSIAVPGKPAYECGFPAGFEYVKVTGAGTIRILRNPRPKSAAPYVVRILTHDRQDLAGPKGLACPESKSKGNK
jgi:hypothetical protein